MGVRARRLGLFAHIAWEQCLDGALVRREEALSIENCARGSRARG